jgi:hemoglobin
MKKLRLNDCNASHCRQAMRCLAISLLAIGLAAGVGCGSAKKEKKKDEFFTSGSREADQRATQRMAKDQQLTGSAEGTEKKAVVAKAGTDGTNAQPASVEGKLSLFDRLGGEAGIAALVDDFTPRLIQDPRVNFQRKDVKSGILRRESTTWDTSPENVTYLKKHLVQFLALATGGPPNYQGKEMKSVHSNLRIGNPEFDAAIGDIKASLDKLKIPNKEQKELLSIIESTRPQIVTQR